VDWFNARTVLRVLGVVAESTLSASDDDGEAVSGASAAAAPAGAGDADAPAAYCVTEHTEIDIDFAASGSFGESAGSKLLSPPSWCA
jgi:hypothetical protein